MRFGFKVHPISFSSSSFSWTDGSGSRRHRALRWPQRSTAARGGGVNWMCSTQATAHQAEVIQSADVSSDSWLVRLCVLDELKPKPRATRPFVEWFGHPSWRRSAAVWSPGLLLQSSSGGENAVSIMRPLWSHCSTCWLPLLFCTMCLVQKLYNWEKRTCLTASFVLNTTPFFNEIHTRKPLKAEETETLVFYFVVLFWKSCADASILVPGGLLGFFFSAASACHEGDMRLFSSLQITNSDSCCLFISSFWSVRPV